MCYTSIHYKYEAGKDSGGVLLMSSVPRLGYFCDRPGKAVKGGVLYNAEPWPGLQRTPSATPQSQQRRLLARVRQ